MRHIVDKVKQVYAQLNRDNIAQISEIYAQDILFIDPVSRVQGLDKLTAHFADTYSNVTKATFTFHEDDEIIMQNMAYLNWQMSFAHPKLKGGQDIVVDGVSLLRYEEKVVYHRDWFDMGAMIYQHVPIIGSVVKILNGRLSA